MNPFLEADLWQTMAAVHTGSPKRYQSPNLIFSSYHMKLNLLTFVRGQLPFNVTVVGLPLSLSQQGYVFLEACGKTELLRWVLGQRGLTVILNGDESMVDSLIDIETLPTVCLANRFTSMAHYVSDLRAHYRYRFKRAVQKFKAVKVVSEPVFDETLYGLYEAVFNRSDFPLEKCSIEYFKQFPGEIEAFYADDQPLGFYQTIILDEILYFVFCGLDYSRLKTYDTYYNMLLHLVEKGISKGVKAIDFGQTTEDIKQKLGGRLISKKIYLHHSNPVFRLLLRVIGPYMDYKLPEKSYHVFKEV